MRALKAKLTVVIEDYSGYDVRGLVGQHGLSVLVEVEDGGGRVRRVLFDTGQEGGTLLRNLRILGLGLKGVEAIAVSHRHYDHTGGLIEVLREVSGRVPVIAHPHLFTPSMYVGGGDVSLSIGAPFTRGDVAAAGGELLLVKSPIQVVPGVWWLGEIERVTDFEEPPKGFYRVEGGEVVPDEIPDDTGLAIDIEGLGLVVISGCSHSGIVNIVEQALRVTGSELYAVMGGLHLVTASRERIERTVGKLRELGAREAWVGHCTGLRAEAAFLEAFKEGFRKIHSGFTLALKGT